MTEQEAMRSEFDRCMATHWNDWQIAWQAALAWAAQGQEPVAWTQPDHLAKAKQAPFLCRVEPSQRDDFVPLYTHPAPDRLREALEQSLVVLGPSAPECEGCATEIAEALEIIKSALAKGE